MMSAFALRFPLTPLSTNQGPPQIRPSPSRASLKSSFSCGAQAPAQTRRQEPPHSRNGWLGKENQKEGRENAWENKKSQMLARTGLTHAGGGISGRAKPDPLLTGQEHKLLAQAQLTRCLWRSAALAPRSPSSFSSLQLHCLHPTSESIPKLPASPPSLSSRLQPAGCPSEARFPQGDPGIPWNPGWPLILTKGSDTLYNP